MKHLIIFIFAAIFYACSTSQAGDAESHETARLSHVESSTTEVGIVPVQTGDFELELISNGKLEARRKAVVPFAVQEQIVDVSVREGQSVATGQILGKVEPFTFQKRLSDATNTYDQAVIDLEVRLLGHGYALSDTASVPEGILKMALIRSNNNNNAVSSSQRKQSCIAKIDETCYTNGINGKIQIGRCPQ